MVLGRSVFAVALAEPAGAELALTLKEQGSQSPWFCHGIECPKCVYTSMSFADRSFAGDGTLRG